MNAAEQATSIEFASKIAAVVGLFKTEFPDLRADLTPWANDYDTQAMVDPDSIDLGFHFPGVSRRLQCRSLLVQIRFYSGPDQGDAQRPALEGYRRVIGLEVAGFDHRGKQWSLSTIDQWAFTGNSSPQPEVGDRLRYCCRQVFEVFNVAESWGN